MLDIKVKEKLLKVFSVFFILTFIGIVLNSIFNSSNWFHSMGTIVLIVGSISLLISLYLVDRILKKLESNKLKKIRIIAFIFMIILQVSFFILLRINPAWDYGVVLNSGVDISQGNIYLSEYYYQKYPNNIGIALLLGTIFKFVHLFTNEYDIYVAVAALFNIFMINLSIYLLYKFIYKIFGESRATLYTIFILFITPFYSYAQICYTDTVTMVFPIIMMFLLYEYISNDKKNKFIYLIGIGALGSIGVILKTNIIIGLIAIIIYLFFTNKTLSGIKQISIILVSFLCIFSIYKNIAQNYIPIDYDDAGLPASHWIMMGLSGPYGGYNSYDVEFSSAIRDTEGKEPTAKANIKVIKERLREYGVIGYIKFIANKIAVTWNDGTYFAPAKLGQSPTKNTFLSKYVIGEKNGDFVYISQFSHIIMLVGILVGSICSYKDHTDFYKVVQICLFGVFLFLILWETRSRYLVCYLPIIVFSSFYGLDCIFKYIDEKLKKLANYKYD